MNHHPKGEQVNHAEPDAPTPSSKTGLFATLRALLTADGSAAPSADFADGTTRPPSSRSFLTSPAEQAHLPSLAWPRRRASIFTAICASLLAATALLAGSAAITTTPAKAAEPCPNEAIREAEGSTGTALPDCRAYEQVSPVGLEKNGADALGSAGSVQASSPGSSFAYFSLLPFVGVSAADEPQYLGSRSSSWSFRGIYPSLEPGTFVSLHALTEDNAAAIIEVGTEQPTLLPCEPEARVCDPGPARATAYLIDTATGAFHFLAEYPRQSNALNTALFFAAATPDDSQILFETKAQLLPAATAEKYNLYRWDASEPAGHQLSLVGLLPASEGGLAPSQGSLVTSACGSGDRAYECYTQHALSADGSRAFFTDLGTGRLYERLIQAEETVPVSPGSAEFRAATPDGRYLFYTEAGGLYRFNTQTETTTELVVSSAGVEGSLGVSDDGTVAYFVATAALTGAERNEWGAQAESGPGKVDLYRWHEDPQSHAAAISFIVNALALDRDNWLAGEEPDSDAQGPSGGQRSSRLTPDGSVLLLSSSANLTSYQSAGQTEFYRYDSAAPPGARLSCVTCSPSGAPPTVGKTRLESTNEAIVAHPAPPPLVPRNLSADGAVVFFQTAESLLPADTNGVLDIYEWEASGHGSCPAVPPGLSAPGAHCLFLLSTGTAAQESYFGDASASGEDAFFFTRQPLVSQDTDNNVDVYDARVNGGIASQSPPPPPRPCEAEACRPPVTTRPTEPTPASESLIGFPNSTYCRPGFVKRSGTCVKKKKHHRRHKRHARAHHRRANRNRGGGK